MVEEAGAPVASTESEPASTTPEPAAPEEPAKGFSYVVGGGTGTAKSEAMYEERFHEAERRRDVSDRERAIAQTPIEHGGGQLFTNQMTAHPDIPRGFILLKYVDRHGNQIVINGEPTMCCADLIVGLDPERPTELSLMIVCPRCQQQSHKHLQDNQILIRQSNKRFEFRAAMGPATFVYDGKTFRSAGMIIESEAFRCHDCGWRARIDHNRVWPD